MTPFRPTTSDFASRAIRPIESYPPGLLAYNRDEFLNYQRKYLSGNPVPNCNPTLNSPILPG